MRRLPRAKGWATYVVQNKFHSKISSVFTPKKNSKKGILVDRIVLNKLVRDKVTEILNRKGVKYKAARVHNIERALARKLHEEVGELLSAKPKDRAGELADVYEVLEALAKHWGVRMQKVRTAQKKKRRAKGGFSKGILLFWTEASNKK
ncbi:MAG: nucleoside triphosphate pyrophosphohydrolase [Candidatus Pacebacteria bacterium]|jgi:predicted house-cleaning noncanonical NTP pyrophosphatase (MazG superfamily)|nr:nucleoside triphosphate pyrophosphohydrolase [Candidatus Paceibacterota bacterium]